MSETRRYFGTDGIRGRVGTHPITPEFVLKLGWAVGRILQKRKQPFLIGKDTRISGYMLESALEAGLSASGSDCYLLGPMPTPAIAYLTSALQASAGIIISASHNGYEDNGIKFFSAQGTKLADNLEYAIEQQLNEPLITVGSAQLGKAHRVEEAKARYLAFCRSTFPKNKTLEGLHIVLDCAHGATYQIAPQLFSELGATLTLLGVQPNGTNINLDCGSTHLSLLQKTVVAKKAHLGIAFDGDGDRVLMVDHLGEMVDGDELVFLLAQAGVENGDVRGGVVGTLMSNLGLEQAIKQLGLDFIRTAVGDRYVNECLHSTGWQLGGEASGHIILRDKLTTGDGIVIALQILAILSTTHQTLHQAKKDMRKFPQTLINVAMSNPTAVFETALVQNAIQSIEKTLGNQGRLVVRPSGTEPVVRVMVEARDEETTQKLANSLACVLRNVNSA